MAIELTPELLLSAYAQGIFPMADEDGEIVWFSPDPRAIFDLNAFHIPRTLRQVYRQNRFELSVDRAFPAVIDACSRRPEGTWISTEIKSVYTELHELGFAHSVEAWQNDELAGGLYGVAIGGAFCGESMFHRVTDASKIALVFLVERMKACGFTLLDVQFTTSHLDRFHCRQISRADYLQRLEKALRLERRLTASDPAV